MPLVFHAFADTAAAERFAAAVSVLEPELETNIHDDADAAADEAIFPFHLVAPVVLVERPYSGHDSDIETARDGGFADDTPTGAEREAALESAVIAFGGRYAGT